MNGIFQPYEKRMKMPMQINWCVEKTIEKGEHF